MTFIEISLDITTEEDARRVSLLLENDDDRDDEKQMNESINPTYNLSCEKLMK